MTDADRFDLDLYLDDLARAWSADLPDPRGAPQFTVPPWRATRA